MDNAAPIERTVTFGEVTALNHELLDHPVKS